MQNTLLEEIEDMERILQSGSATDALRERLQGYFDELLYQAGSGAPPRLLEDAYRRGMRTLRAFYNAQSPCAQDGRVRLELNAFFEDLAFCCDLLCGEGRVVFCPTRTVQTVCAPRALLWAALEMLACALRLSGGAPILLRVFAHTDFAGFAVSAPASVPADALARAASRPGSGLCFARRTADAHGGRLLSGCAGRQATLAFSIRRSGQDALCPAGTRACFADWLSDRLSPVYAALSDLCAPPAF